MKFFTLIFLLVVSCGYFRRHDEAKPKADDRLTELKQKTALKKLELTFLLDENGFPKRQGDCDQTLWVGKACAAGVPVKISLVEYAPGEIHRRPAPSCWDGEDHGSSSTVSNDMLTGYLACLLATKDLQALERLAAYGEEHKVTLPIPGWQMGKPYPEMAARVVMRANGIGLVGRMLRVLSGGAVTKDYETYPSVFGPVSSDFERHLQAESIYLNGKVRSPAAELIDINDLEFQRLQALVEAEPSNPFFNAVLGVYTGDMAHAIELLLDDKTPVPTYVRGEAQEAYELIHWLRASEIVLERFAGD